MANKYCDTSAYTYAATPTWGVAQDGDGSSTGVATPSTAEVVFTGIPTTGSIAVLGIALSPTWVTSADVCANNLATAINASASTATGPASFTIKSQVRNHIYARGPANGAPAGTCQIMTRQASADHAGLIAITHTLNNVSSAATINFVGGSGGVWGYLFNPSGAIWPNATAIGTYGIWAGGQPFCGVQADGDIVHVRANNNVVTNTNAACTVTAYGNLGLTAPIVCIIGDPLVWTSDSPSSTLTINNNAGMDYNLHLTFNSARAYMIVGRELSKDYYNLKFYNTGSGAGDITLQFMNNCSIDGFNLEVTTATTANSVYLLTDQVANLTGRPRYANGTVKHNNSGSFTYYSSNYTRVASFDNIVFDNGGAVSPNNGVIYPMTNAPQVDYDFRNCRFVNFIVGSRLFATALSLNVNVSRFVFTDCNFGNVTQRGPYSASIGSLYEYSSSISSFTSVGNRDFSIDNTCGYVGWNSAINQPVLRALLPDSSTLWSMLLAPPAVAGRTSINRPLNSPRLVKINSLATGARTFTLELCISDALSWNKRDVSLEVSYRTATGDLVVLSTLDYYSGALTASTVTWNQESGGKVTFQDGGTLYHNKYKLVLTTPTGRDLPLGAEVSALFKVHTPRANTTQYIFIDPDMDIT